MTETSQKNLFFRAQRMGIDLSPGILLQNARYRQATNPIPSIVIGEYNQRGGWVAPGGSKVPVSLQSLPKIGDGKALAGSIVEIDWTNDDGETKKRKELVAFQDGDAWYVLIRTGVLGYGRGVMNDYLKLLGELQETGDSIFSHGSYGLDGGAVEIGSGEGQLDIPDVKAELVKHGRARNFLDRGIPAYTYRLWRVPPGAMLLDRDINGELRRTVGEPDTPRVVDATGYEQVFEDLEEKRRQERAAERKRARQKVES